MNQHPSKKLHPIALAAALTLSALTVFGCGQTGYDPSGRRVSVDGPGTYAQAPKIDLLLALDDTGGMSEGYKKIQAQMPGFLTNIQNSGWDFHFATTPLNTERSLSQVAASTHDINWGSAWTPPYPGASQNNLFGMLPSWLFRKIGNYSDFNVTTNRTGASEHGFETILKTLTTVQTGTNFVRDDALLAVLVVGVGEDTSYVNMCPSSIPGEKSVVCGSAHNYPKAPKCADGSLPSNVDGDYNTCNSSATSLDYYTAALNRVKQGKTGAFKFYAAVAAQKQSGCQGANSFAGSRYRAMAARLGGEKYDICTQDISVVLTGLKSSLETQRQSLEMAYLFLDQEPVPSTITVTVYRAATPNTAEVLPQDATNGWQYAGLLTDVYAIDVPTQLNKSTGYALALNGQGRLKGDDRVEIDFTPAGVNSSTTK